MFGKNSDRGVRMAAPFRPEVVTLGGGVTEKDLVVHDEAGPPGYAFMLAHMEAPDFPVPIGVLRNVAMPSFETEVHEQIAAVTRKRGLGDLETLLRSGDVWQVT